MTARIEDQHPTIALPVYDEMHPVLRRLIWALVLKTAPRLLARGWHPWPNDSGRRREHQADRWSQGRNSAGEVIDAAKVVTMARAGASYHETHYADGSLCALACHVNPRNEKGGVSGWGACRLDAEAYGIIGIEAEALGLTWGGRFDVSPAPGVQPDLAHLELRIPGATRDQVQAAILAGQALGASLTVTA